MKQICGHTGARPTWRSLLVAPPARGGRRLKDSCVATFISPLPVDLEARYCRELRQPTQLRQGPPRGIRTQEFEFTIFLACEPLVQAATPAATGDRLQDRVPRILTGILTTHPPTPGTLGVTAHEWPATGFLQTTDRNPGIGVYDYRQTGTRI